MSEKRFGFEMDKNCYKCIVDIRDKKLYTDKKQVVDLLNDLNDECDFLEIENEALEDGATKYAELYHKSLKENEQLEKKLQIYKSEELETLEDLQRCQQNIEKCVKKIDSLEVENEQLKSEIEKLSDENEELKQSVNNLKDTIVSIGIAYQKKHDGTLVDLVDGTLEEDIIEFDKIKVMMND